jgi:hypothetical protein
MSFQQFSARAKKNFIVGKETIKSAEGKDLSEDFGVRVSLLQDGKIRLFFTEEKTVLTIERPKAKERKMNDIEYAALMTTQLAINEAFADERLGVDQAGFIVGQESNIGSLPGFRECDPDSALRWACATLQGIHREGKSGWSAEEIAEYWLDKNPQIKASLSLGSLSREEKDANAKRLENVLKGYFPGNSK